VWKLNSPSLTNVSAQVLNAWWHRGASRALRNKALEVHIHSCSAYRPGPLEIRDCGFSTRSGHECVSVFLLYCRSRPRDRPVPRPRSPTKYIEQPGQTGCLLTAAGPKPWPGSREISVLLNSLLDNKSPIVFLYSEEFEKKKLWLSFLLLDVQWL
jgi:hypothetical protein